MRAEAQGRSTAYQHWMSNHRHQQPRSGCIQRLWLYKGVKSAVCWPRRETLGKNRSISASVNFQSSFTWLQSHSASTLTPRSFTATRRIGKKKSRSAAESDSYGQNVNSGNSETTRRSLQLDSLIEWILNLLSINKFSTQSDRLLFFWIVWSLKNWPSVQVD